MKLESMKCPVWYLPLKDSNCGAVCYGYVNLEHFCWLYIMIGINSTFLLKTHFLVLYIGFNLKIDMQSINRRDNFTSDKFANTQWLSVYVPAEKSLLVIITDDVYILYALFLYLITEEYYNRLLYNWLFKSFPLNLVQLIMISALCFVWCEFAFSVISCSIVQHPMCMWFYVLPVKNTIGFLERPQCVTHIKTWNNQTGGHTVA